MKHIDSIIPKLNAITKPVILLIGPASAGKTVTLIRLAKYLRSKGDFKILPNEDFRDDEEYSESCKQFQHILNSNNLAPAPTVPINFLLVDIYRNNKLDYHILEAPGEHFFDTQNPYQNTNRAYLASLFSKDVKKVMVFIFEKNMLSSDELQQAYANRLSHFVSLVKPKNEDRILFMLNKVDKLPVQEYGTVNAKEVKKYIYENSNFNSLKHAIINVKGLDPVAFIPFSSGTFNEIDEGKQSMVLSNEDYPKSLWNSITKPYKTFLFWKW